MINIQCDWNECFANDGGHAWILYKQYQKPADHDKLKKTGNDTLAIGDKFKARFLRPRVLEVTHIPTGRRVTCVAPVSSYSDLIPSSKITNVDVSSGGLGVVSSDNEKLSVWETATGTVRYEVLIFFIFSSSSMFQETVGGTPGRGLHCTIISQWSGGLVWRF